MHGGNPKKGEVYGYTGWNENGGYASFHNPSETEGQTYSFTLDRAFGVNKDLDKFSISSPLPNAGELIGKTISGGEKMMISLQPGEVKILEFNKN